MEVASVIIPEFVATARRPAISLPREVDVINTAAADLLATNCAKVWATGPGENFETSTPAQTITLSIA